MCVRNVGIPQSRKVAWDATDWQNMKWKKRHLNVPSAQRVFVNIGTWNNIICKNMEALSTVVISASKPLCIRLTCRDTSGPTRAERRNSCVKYVVAVLWERITWKLTDSPNIAISNCTSVTCVLLLTSGRFVYCDTNAPHTKNVLHHKWIRQWTDIEALMDYLV